VRKTTLSGNFGEQWTGSVRVEYELCRGNTDIEDNTIIVHPTNNKIGCSPDGLSLSAKLGYEYKTKDHVPIPPTNVDILPCEYMQCQMCLACCEGFGLDGWIICYNRLDTNETAAYFIEFDRELWDDWFPDVEEFVSRGVAGAEAYMAECCESNVPVDFDDFFKKNIAYDDYTAGEKIRFIEQLKTSMQKHATKIHISFTE